MAGPWRILERDQPLFQEEVGTPVDQSGIGKLFEEAIPEHKQISTR